MLLVHDVFPENLIAAKILNSNNFLYKICKYLFNKVYTSADEIIVIGSDMKYLIDSKTLKNNSTVIPNWIDCSDICISPRQLNPLLVDLNWHSEDATIFQFFGNIGRVQGISTLLHAISGMKHPELAKFIFIGSGVFEQELHELIKNLNLTNTVYIGAIGQNQKSLGLNACDIAIVTLADGMYGLGVPSKSYYYMAADKPLFAIMDSNTEIPNMIKLHNIGWNIEPNNIEAISKKLDTIALMKRNYSSLNSPRKVLLSNYSTQLAMNKILDILNKL